jgi:hypothetical protein
LRGDEAYEELEILKSVADNVIMVLHNLPYGGERDSRVHSARR